MGRKPKPQDEKAEHRVYTYLPSPLKARFDALAQSRGVGVGTLLRQLIERELEEGESAHAARVIGATALQGLAEAGFQIIHSPAEESESS